VSSTQACAQTVALDAEHPRELNGVDELPRWRWLHRDQLGHPPGELLDVGRVKPHARAPLREAFCAAVAVYGSDDVARRSGMTLCV
jgi:hypothetical protein